MDLAITPNGDFIVGPDGDLLAREGGDELKDDIIFRIRTYLGDYRLQPALGTELESFIGQPHTRSLLDAAVQDIEHALTYDSFLVDGEFDVTAIPVTADQAVFVIRVYLPDEAEPLPVVVPFSLTDGFTIA